MLLKTKQHDRGLTAPEHRKEDSTFVKQLLRETIAHAIYDAAERFDTLTQSDVANVDAIEAMSTAFHEQAIGMFEQRFKALQRERDN